MMQSEWQATRWRRCRIRWKHWRPSCNRHSALPMTCLERQCAVVVVAVAVAMMMAMVVVSVPAMATKSTLKGLGCLYCVWDVHLLRFAVQGGAPAEGNCNSAERHCVGAENTTWRGETQRNRSSHRGIPVVPGNVMWVVRIHTQTRSDTLSPCVLHPSCSALRL